MDSISIETRIIDQIMDDSTICNLCRDPLDSDADHNDENHSVVPVWNNRIQTCGHIIHLGCGLRVVGNLGRTANGEFSFSCPTCRFKANRFETAYCLEGKLLPSVK